MQQTPCRIKSFRHGVGRNKDQASVVQKHNQNDQRDRDSEQPKQDRHDYLLSFCLRC